MSAIPSAPFTTNFFKTGKVGKAATYVVEGIGEDIFPSTMEFKYLDDIEQINDEECFVWARKLVKQEGLFTGGSGGGCISAALKVAKRCKKGDVIVAFLPDTGMRYLSKVYSDEWMSERGYADSEIALRAADIVLAKRKNGKERELIIARADQTVFHALHTMQKQDISQLPVFEEKLPIGTIFEDQIKNLAPARKRFAQTCDPRSDGQSAPHRSKRCARRTRYTFAEPRIAGCFCGHGRFTFRHSHQIRFDEHHRRNGRGHALIVSFCLASFPSKLLIHIPYENRRFQCAS